MTLADALDLAGAELVSFVGAGGKKTAMARLAREGDGRGLAVGYTTTAHVPPPPFPLVLSPPDRLGAALSRREESPLAFARERVDDPERVDEKVRGFDPDDVDRTFESGRFDWLLVKADGARMREFKAPGEGEPPVPGASTVVVPVASVRAVGEPLSDAAVHRPERVAETAGVRIGATLAPAHVGAVLADDRGGLKRVPEDARVVPLVNKADTPELRETARAVLAAAFERTGRFDRGLVTSLETGEVDVVRRGDLRAD